MMNAVVTRCVKAFFGPLDTWVHREKYDKRARSLFLVCGRSYRRLSQYRTVTYFWQVTTCPDCLKDPNREAEDKSEREDAEALRARVRDMLPKRGTTGQLIRRR